MVVFELLALVVLGATAFEAHALLRVHREILVTVPQTRLRALANPEGLARELCADKVRQQPCFLTMAIHAERANDTNDDFLNVCERLGQLQWQLRRYYQVGVECRGALGIFPLPFHARLFKLKSP